MPTPRTQNPGNMRVRFAPSPTGQIHVGNVRTALFNWLLARGNGGTFVVRIEDTDEARSTEQSEEDTLDDLRWLGLAWSEGVGVGGAHGPYRQSERASIYQEHAATLLAGGHAYYCFCSTAALEAGRPIAYNLGGVRLPTENTPLRAWERVFGPASSGDAVGRRRRTTLDFAYDEYRQLAPQLGATDRAIAAYEKAVEVAPDAENLSAVAKPKQPLKPMAAFRARMPRLRRRSAILLREARDESL